MNAKNSTAVVTGGGSGIGAAIAARLAADGFDVLVADRDLGTAQACADGIAAAGGRAAAVRVDVAAPDEVAAMVAGIAAHAPLAVMVACAGIGIQRSLLETGIDDWNRIIAVNLTGTFLCGQAAARAMVPLGRGRIINISSGASLRGVPGRAAYGASKGGVNTLTQVMAAELGQHGITVNAIAPGPIETAMTRQMHTAETRAAYLAALPLKRYGALDEIAATASFLASDGGGFITGQTIVADGGLTSAGPLFDL